MAYDIFAPNIIPSGQSTKTRGAYLLHEIAALQNRQPEFYHKIELSLAKATKKT